MAGAGRRCMWACMPAVEANFGTQHCAFFCHLLFQSGFWMVLHIFTLARGRQCGEYGWAGPLDPVYTWFNAANMSIMLDVNIFGVFCACAGGLNRHLITASRPVTQYTLIVWVQGWRGVCVFVPKSWTTYDPSVSVSVGKAPAHLASEGSGLDTAGAALPSEAAKVGRLGTGAR